MEDIKRCVRCILPESIPSITLDNEGVCNYCRAYDNSFANWEKIKQRKTREFENLLQQAKRLNRPYDCLIPLSGGKDSTYTLYLCSKVYGLKCLCVTVDNGFLTNRAKMNIQNALKETDADHIFFNFNRASVLKLYRLFLMKCGEFCPACMRCINLSIEKTAKMFNIPLVIKGSGRRVQYVSQIPELGTSNSPSFFKNVVKGEPLEKDFSQMFSDQKTLEIQKMLGALSDLLKIPRTRLMRYVTQHIGLYDYLYTPRNEVYRIIKDKMGWEKSVDTFEHMDCQLHEIPFYIQTLKIPELTTETLYNSGLIRQGLMTRNEAMNIENEKLNNPKPPEELSSFLKDIKMSYDDFVGFAQELGKAKQFNPKMGTMLRRIYHRRRKY